MASYNRIIILGNLARSPESRVLASGMHLCKFCVATNRKFKKQDGEEQEEVCFIDVDAFGKKAEVIQEYLTKGDPILIEGRLCMEKWESKEGEKRSKHKIFLESFTFLPAQDRKEPHKMEEYRDKPKSASTQDKGNANSDDEDEDVPF